MDSKAVTQFFTLDNGAFFMKMESMDFLLFQELSDSSKNLS